MAHTIIDFTVIGSHIKYYSNKRGYSQAELAEKIGSSVPYISYVETGKKQIGVEYLVRIAEVLNVSVDGLLMGNTVNDKESALEMPDELFCDTSPYEKAIIIETARSAKQALRKYSTLSDGSE